MTILFTIAQAFNPNDGGVQRTTYKLGKFFSEQGLEVWYYSTSVTGHLKPEYGQLLHCEHQGGLYDSRNLEVFEEAVRKIQPTIVINQMPYEASLRDNLYRLKKEEKFTLLGCLRNSLFSVKNNIRDVVQGMAPGLIFRLLDNPIALDLCLAIHRRKHKKQLKKIVDKHDRFILLAPPNKEELNYFIGDYKASTILTIPNSIPAIFSEKFEEKENIILHVGRLNIAQKRSDLLLPFWEKCHDLLPDWKFIVVGDGPYKKQMEAEITQKELPRIELVGFQAPEKYYRQAKLFVMPSAFEGFPNVLLEAQSYGVVPVAFNSYPAISCIVEDTKNAILIPPFEVDKMVGEAVKLAQNRIKLKEMGRSALDNAENFTIEQVGKQWVALFETL